MNGYKVILNIEYKVCTPQSEFSDVLYPLGRLVSQMYF
jgi:hypothetical protein